MREVTTWIAGRRGPIAALAYVLLLMFRGHAIAQTAADPHDFSQIERGRYLATAADCTACHTNPAGGAPFAGGRDIETPFGKLRSPNITPDPTYGIGSWTDENFDAALRRGRRPDGSRLYPAMPYTFYARMSRQDALAIRAFLNTLAPVRVRVKVNLLPFPFSIRAIMIVWDALFFRPEEFHSDAKHTAQWNRGAFLVQGPGHCGACHTPKNPLGADENERALRGYTLQNWFAPDLTQDPQRGLREWSQADMIKYLKTGHNRLAAASGPMAEEVAYSSSQMDAADLAAIAEYLKGQAADTDSVAPLPRTDPTVVAGRAIYVDLCSACHQHDGSGVAALIPNIAASASVASKDPTSVLRVLLEGARSVATDEEPTAPAMPGFGGQLSDLQVACVANYIRNSWGHAASAISADEVRKLRKALQKSR
jgi:mono/diheme cytochrome c family protein